MLFSGLGVDGGLFGPQRSLPVRLLTPDWIDPLGHGETVERYARRMAEQIAPELGRLGDGPLYLGGLSFGAAVALEAARILRPAGIFLMSFGYSGHVLAPHLRVMLRGASWVPPPAMRQMLRLTPLFIRVVGRPDRRQRDFLVRLVPRVNVRQCVWGAGALLDWVYRGDPPVPVRHIHGDIDRIVPVENVRPDVVLPAAGHALNVTHAAVVNGLLAKWMGVGGSGGVVE